MELWKKVYILTMFLAVILINSGIYMVFHMTYQKDIAIEQKRAQAEYIMINSAITRNMKVLDEQGRCKSAQLRALMEIYETYYEKENITLKLWKGEKCIYPKEGKSREKELFVNEKEKITVLTIGKEKFVRVTGGMKSISNGSYYLYYEKPLSELTDTWRKLNNQYLGMSFSTSALLAFILFFLLQRLMKPIQELSIVVSDMKEGVYNSRVTVKGKDDITKLGENFNEMADIISENIKCIQEEARKKQEFVDNFAHELKSPLTSIYGFAEYVEKTNISEEEKQECMEFIMEESKRMLNLSYTLLDMSKIRGNTIDMQPVSVKKLCQQVKNQMKDRCDKKGIILDFQYEVDQIYGSEWLLQSLFGNLISNGIFSCERNGRIFVEVIENGEYCQITVTDNGCGMTEEQTLHIMEPFYRVDKARSRENGRTGLGLSLCQQIVEVHRGEIKFYSILGEGTKVIVKLPLTLN